MSRVMAIINGTKRGARPAAVRAELERRGITTVCTQRPGHAVELARSAAGYDGIISVGGDGTVHEVLCGMDPSRQWLGVVRMGTTNCIARALGVQRLQAVLDAVDAGGSMAADFIDVSILRGDVREHRRVIGFLALGFEAALTRTARRWHRLPAVLRYGLGALWRTVLLRSFEAQVAVDGAVMRPHRFTSLLINNCGTEIFSTLPAWRLDDGAVEVQAVRRSMAGQFVHNFVRVVRVPRRRSWQTGVASLTCECARPQAVMVDGELIEGVNSLALTVRRAALKLKVPACALPCSQL